MQKRVFDKKEERLQKRKKQLERHQKLNDRKRLLPLAKAFILWVIMVFIVNFPQFKDHFAGFFIEFTTRMVLFFSRLLYLPVVRVSDQIIAVSDYRMNIIYECTAYNFYVFVIPLILFSKWPMKNKLINLLIFLGSIIIANVFRFIVMGYIGQWYPEFFHSLHDYIWNIIFGLLIFLLWILMERKVRTSQKFVPA